MLKKVLTGLVAGREVPVDSRKFNPLIWQQSFMEIGQEIICTAILSLLLIQVEHLSDTVERM